MRIIADARINPVLETVIASLVSLSIIFFGILNGMAIGIASAIVLFAYNYRRIPVVWATISGVEVRSNVVRSPEVARLLETEGARIVLFRLQGYLFFLNVSSLRAAVEKRADEKPATERYNFRLQGRRRHGFIRSDGVSADWPDRRGKEFRCGIRRTRMSELRELFDRARMWSNDRLISVESTDRALEFAEDRLVAESLRGSVPEALTLPDALARFAPGQVSADRLARYLEHVELQPNQVLMRLGDPAEAMFFVESRSGHGRTPT